MRRQYCANALTPVPVGARCPPVKKWQALSRRMKVFHPPEDHNAKPASDVYPADGEKPPNQKENVAAGRKTEDPGDQPKSSKPKPPQPTLSTPAAEKEPEATYGRMSKEDNARLTFFLPKLLPPATRYHSTHSRSECFFGGPLHLLPCRWSVLAGSTRLCSNNLRYAACRIH